MSTAGVTQKPASPRGTARRWIGEFAALLALPARAPRRLRSRAPMLPAARVALGLLAAVALIGTAMVFLDAWAFAQAKRLPIWVIDLFNQITDYGKSNWFLWPSGILIIVLAGLAITAPRWARLTLIALIVRFEFIFVAIGLPGLVVTIVKRFIGRVRPSALGPFAYFPFSWRPDYAGMPSGHATTAFAAAVVLGALWPRARPVLWLYAIVIALSRVVISAHYVSDVVAGAFVGGFGALIIRNYFAARRLGFAAAPDGTVHALPGPSLRRLKSIAARLFTPAA